METYIEKYLKHCKGQKRLDDKTLKAYRIDLGQFCKEFASDGPADITTEMLENYIEGLHKTYKPKTVKRKLASLKAFFHYLEYKDIIIHNPFGKIQVKFREPRTLPKTIPLHAIEALLLAMYKQKGEAKTDHQKKTAIRDIAVIELLFATGIRISELCSLKMRDIDLEDRSVLIYGKGSKERKVQIGDDAVVKALQEYEENFHDKMHLCGHFFVSQNGTVLSDQVVRRMINHYASKATLDMHITPHMFRHTFATSLLEADVDIRYIQEMLGHSSINVTEIYTHVAMSKQRDILMTKHPRKDLMIGKGD